MTEKKTACKIVFCDVVDEYIHDFLLFLGHEELFNQGKAIRLEYARRTCGTYQHRVNVAAAIAYALVRTVEYIAPTRVNEMLGFGTWSSQIQNAERRLRDVGFDMRSKWVKMNGRRFVVTPIGRQILALLPDCSPGLTWTDLRMKTWHLPEKQQLTPEYRFVLDQLVRHGYVTKDWKGDLYHHPHYWKVKEP